MMDELVRDFVRSRANDRCEYCLLPQSIGSSIRFHIEHIRSRQHGGTDHPDNLALACPNCNWYKGPNIAGVDPETSSLAPLFDPRIEKWHDHFKLFSIRIEGQTPSGRATVELLRMNAPERIDVRRRLIELGQF